MIRLLKQVFAVFATFALIAGCGSQDGTTTGNPLVNIQLEGHVSSASQKISVLSVSGLTFCFKRLRFKTDSETTDPDPTIDEDNIDLDIGELAITGSAQDLASVEVPPGSYKRVEFDLEDGCTSGKSVQLTNGSGSFSTTERITIKFEGDFVLGEADATLPISLQNVVDQLNLVTADNQIKSRAESASGSF